MAFTDARAQVRVCTTLIALMAAGVSAAPVAPHAPAMPSLPTVSADPSTSCSYSKQEMEFIQYFTGTLQNRSQLRCEPVLQEYARLRARDMARRQYLSHITPERKGPNRMLRELGYPLPHSYLNGLANNVESIVGGIEAPVAVWEALIESPDHRPHLLGEAPGFLEQDEFGVAYYRDIYAPHVDYWVVVIARRPRPGEPEVICTPAPSVCFRIGTVSAGDQTAPATAR